MAEVAKKVLKGHLQNVSLQYKNSQYINELVFPMLDLNTNKGSITKYNKGDMFRNEATVRARGGEAKTIEHDFDTVDVSTKPYALKEGIYDHDLEAEGYEGGSTPPTDLKEEAVMNVADKIDLGREIRVADFIHAGTWGGVSGGEDAEGNWAWDAGTNTMISDIETRIKGMISNGIPDMGNLHLALDFGTFQSIDRIPEVRDRLKYTSSEPITAQMLAGLFKIGSVIVGNSIYSTAAEKADKTDFTSKFIWEKNAGKGSAFLFYRGPRVGRKIMQTGYQPRTKKINGSMRLTKEYRIEERAGWFYETEEDTGIAQVAADAGFLWNDTHTT